MDPVMWLVELLLLSGDVDSNPGPTNTRPKRAPQPPAQPPTPRQTTNLYRQPVPSPSSAPASQQQTPPLPLMPPGPQTQLTPNQKKTRLNILQININGLSSKIDQLRLLTKDEDIDIIAVQETKLKTNSKTPNIPDFTPIRTDRTHSGGGGLITYVKNNIVFFHNKIPATINPRNTEIQNILVHLSRKKKLHINNIYIPPRNTRDPDLNPTDQEITDCMNYALNRDKTIILGDFNGHHGLWHSPLTDHRGQLLADLITASRQTILNTDTPTRVSTNRDQQPTSPDITTISDDLTRHTTWKTLDALTSDHKPIKIEIDTKSNYKLVQLRTSYTNYRKADWPNFTNFIEEALQNTENPQNAITGNKLITNIILAADKQYVPKGKIKPKDKLLPEEIRLKIRDRDEIHKNDPLDDRLRDLNRQIDQDIHKYREDLWRQHLDGDWDHRRNTYKLWTTIQRLNNKQATTHPNITIDFNGRTAITNRDKANHFTKQFTNITPHKTQQNTRHIIKQIHQLPHQPILITSNQTSIAIKQSRTNKSTGPDNVNIQHLKHLGPRAIKYLTAIYNLAINSNQIPHIWKLAKIIPIPKPNKDPSIGTSYRPISLLSPIAKTLEKIILPHFIHNTHIPPHQHGFKHKHSTVTALHQFTDHIVSGFNQKRPPLRTIAIAIDLSKAFDTINHTKLLSKLLNTTIPPVILKFTANYLRGRRSYTFYNNTKSKQKRNHTGVPQGGVLSPTLFNIYTADMPPPPPHTHIMTYADDSTLYSSDKDYKTAETRLQPYLDRITDWTKTNDLHLNASKTTTTLFTPDPAEHKATLNLKIDDTILPTVPNPTILGLTFDPKLTFNKHTQATKDKADKTLKILNALTSTNWGKQKETLTNTYKTVTRPILEYASTVWAPMTKPTHINRLQTTQNAALRTATGCTLDTNINHLHDETQILPLDTHLRLHSSQARQKAQHPDHPLHYLTEQPDHPRLMKQTTLNNRNDYITRIDTDPDSIDDDQIKSNLKTIHTTIVQRHLRDRPNNKILDRPPPDIDKSEETLTRPTRRRLAQLRTNKSPLLRQYLHKIDSTNYPTEDCPLCRAGPHDTRHLFNCTEVPTDLTTLDLWTNPCGVADLLDAWEEKLG